MKQAKVKLLTTSNLHISRDLTITLPEGSYRSNVSDLLKIVVTTAVLFAIALASPAKARSSVHTAQLLDKQCHKCNERVAEVKDGRQEVIEQRQQLREARQEVREQLQQLQNIPQDASQERTEQLQQLQEAHQEAIEQRQQLQEARQEVREQRQLQDIPQDTRQELTEQQQQLQDARQERTEQLQQLQNIPQDASQERMEQRQQLQEAHQEVREQRQQLQDVRQDARREVIQQNLGDRWQSEILQQQHLGDRWQSEILRYGYPTSTVSSIRVEFISLTNDQVTVLIEGVNGKQELVFNGNQTKQAIYLSPGIHKLWFKNTQGSSWISGTLNLGQTDLIKIEFNEDKRLVQVDNDLFAWTEDRHSSNESNELNTQ